LQTTEAFNILSAFPRYALTNQRKKKKESQDEGEHKLAKGPEIGVGGFEFPHIEWGIQSNRSAWKSKVEGWRLSRRPEKREVSSHWPTGRKVNKEPWGR